MLAFFRTDRWKRRGVWFRGVGLVLLLIAFFLPVPSAVILAAIIPGVVLFLFGALVWLARSEEPWLRSR